MKPAGCSSRPNRTANLEGSPSILRAPAWIASMGVVLRRTMASSVARVVVTAPVKAVGQVADWTTTSQDESDRNRGREMRKREEQLGKLSRQRDKAAEKCRDGKADQCQRAEVLEHEIEALMAG